MCWRCKPKEEEPKYIGEVLAHNRIEYMNYGLTAAHKAGNKWLTWHKFTAAQYAPEKNHEDFMYIMGLFHKSDAVFFYEAELFKEVRSRISARFDQKEHSYE